MRALVVGLGSIGRRHARNWAALNLGDLLVCRTTNAVQPEPLGVEARYFSGLDDALAEQPDLVIVSNPTSLHVVTARRAVEAGCSVLVEKPIGADTNGVLELLGAAATAKKHVLVGYHLRFHPGLQRARQMLQEHVFGRALYARATAGEYLPGWHPWEDYRTSYSARRDLGGGPILTMSHELDTLCWLLGRPTTVTCMAAHTSHLEIDTEDVAEIVLSFQSGALGTVHVDYLRQPPERTLEVVGESGTLRWDYDRNQLHMYRASTGTWIAETGPALERNDLFKAELRHAAAILGGAAVEPMADGRAGAAILAVALAAQQSAREGGTITLA